jgi:hypothetical protein
MTFKETYDGARRLMICAGDVDGQSPSDALKFLHDRTLP